MHGHFSEPELSPQIHEKRALGLLVLSGATVLTGAWIGFLGWAAIQVVSWAVS